jgi:hypothetical protein
MEKNGVWLAPHNVDKINNEETLFFAIMELD